jgi:hypothetical protein
MTSLSISNVLNQLDYSDINSPSLRLRPVSLDAGTRLAGQIWSAMTSDPEAPASLSPGPQSPWRSRVLVNDAI